MDDEVQYDEPDPQQEPQPTPTPTTTYFTVSYNSNGGTGSISSAKVAKGQSFTLASGGFTKDGHDLYQWVPFRAADNTYFAVDINGNAIGWRTHADISANGYRLRSFNPGTTLVIDDNWIADCTSADSFTFYAVWKARAVAHELNLWIGVPVYKLDGEVRQIDTLGTVPQITNGRTMLPIRCVIEAMGGDVYWDGSSETVTMTCGGKTLRMRIGQKNAWDANNTYPLDSAPVVVGGRTMVPVRTVVEYFGGTVEWNGELSMVTIKFAN